MANRLGMNGADHRIETRDQNESGSSSEKTIGPKSYSYGELAKATDHFSHNNLIGKGGFGHVFKASLDGEIRAIKKLDFSDVQSEGGLEKEIMIVQSLSHKNLVELVGYCIYGANRLLILKYFPNGSLRSKLHGSDNVLDWEIRMKIAIGSARGLEYLHENYNRFWTCSIFYRRCYSYIQIISYGNPCANPLIKKALDGRYTNFIDSNLQSFHHEQMYRMVSCVNSCLNQPPSSRPTMKKIRLVLEGISLPEELYDHKLRKSIIHKDPRNRGSQQ
ncbi:hypothetical protein MANES_11G041100v8 [Manihot esculenta]|uniref:Uncharacterized protein n=2 Tax=Manihot esculenta TaxID=3983 RepID=A0ACB7GUY7_MANES|nr:hypothetical protein MANES_11G041100v8 [Manihot esculenta]KAG8643484.1 hypothetical protein MANES_11G041100v8 [Manihot esculenta]